MRVSLHINGSHEPARTNFISYAPSQCEAVLLEAPEGSGPVTVELKNERTDVGGQVEFYSQRNMPPADSLVLLLPADGTPVPFLAAGKFQRASTENRDACITATEPGSAAVLGFERLMVRVRKDANKLTTSERDRFLNALATLNAQGQGRFSEFRAMHNADVEEEAHGRPGFLGWHRAYLLDLERELQAIEPSVTLPFWRFDMPAPRVFSREFMGVPTDSGTVDFAADNPLLFWRTDNGDGITRSAFFDTETDPAFSPYPSWGGQPVRPQAQTLSRGGGRFSGFDRIEGNPHGYAHTSFQGFIDDPATAPKDPVFYLLHCNIDRLWALWQFVYKRHDVSLGDVAFVEGDRVGHRLDDTLWPWNGDRVPPRPTTPAPGGTFAESPIVAFPGLQPILKSMFDYQGLLEETNRLNFDYEDVPFEWPATPPIV